MTYDEYAYKVYKAVHVSWQVAHESPTQADWKFRWDRMETKLEGVWQLALVLVEHDSPDREIWNAVLNDIEMLGDIAHIHANSKMGGE